MFGIYLFWQDGRVIMVISILIAILLLPIIAKFTNLFDNIKLAILIPSVICILGIIFGVGMALFPNGTGGFTQLFYLSITSYAVDTFVFICIGEGIVLLMKRFIKK